MAGVAKVIRIISVLIWTYVSSFLEQRRTLNQFGKNSDEHTMKMKHFCNTTVTPL
jgi:hypothetical protein